MSYLNEVLIQVLFCTLCVHGVKRYAEQGSNIVLKCPFRADKIDIIWFGPPQFVVYTRGHGINPVVADKVNITGDTMNGEFNLQMYNVQQDDVGKYKCKGEDTSGKEDNYIIEVIVTASPSSDPKITQTPKGQIIVRDNVTLTCTVSGGKPIANISWQCAGDFTETDLSNANEAVSSIQLTISKSDINTMCTCTAKHPLWTPNRIANILLDVAYAPEADPTIQQIPTGGIITGKNVTLICTVSGGNPLATLNWNCTGFFFNTTTGTTASYGVRFIVDKTFNNRKCSCSATHPDRLYRPNVDKEIIVFYPPDSYPSIQQTTPGPIISGDKVALLCTVSGGNPLVTLTWNCTGAKTNNTSGTTASYGVTFTVNKTFDNQICSCSATHPVATYKPIVQHILDVYYEPETNLNIQQLPGGGIIDKNNVTLICTVSGGNPLANLSWNCSGSTLNTITGTTVSYSVEFTVNKNDNNKICSCSAKHPVTSYRPTAQHSLVVFYVPENKQTVKQIPSGGIVKGNAVTLSCSVEGGNPLPTLSWDCIGDILNSTSDNTANYSLKLNVQKDDNGKVCNCTAMHMIASYRPSIQHSLVVYYPPDDRPTIIQDPPGGIVAGNNTTLTCKVSGGNPLVTLVWNCTGIDKNTTADNTASYSVELSVNKNDNSKICTCSSVHPDPSYTYTVQRELIVYFGPERAEVIADPTMPWFEGNKTSLICSYEEGNPAAKIQWKRKNFVTSSYNKSIFHLGEVGQNDDNLSMTCVVSNDYGMMESDALYFNIEYFPKIQLEKPNMLTEEGQNITLSCKAIGNPSPNVSWFFERNVEMTTPTKGISELSLVDIDRQDDGKYTCKASSISHTYGQLVSVNDTLVVVNFPPDVFVNKNSTSTSEHTDLTLTCNANGKPHMYTYEWQHKFGEQYIRTLPSTSATLILTNMSYQDIGRYVCFVNNGIKDRKGILNQANHTTIELQFTPVFVRYDEVTTGKIGNNITSAVEFISFPDIKSPVQWRNATQNAALESNANISITIERRSVQANLHGTSVSFDKFAYRSSIHLSNFNENQDGFYNLLVNNSVGVNDLTIRIVLSDRPKPPTNFYASVIGSTVATFTWTGGFNGGNNQTFIITYWKEHSVIKNYARIPEDNEKDYVFEISMLMPSTTYIFSINATNDEGYSEYVNNTIIVSTKDVPESAASIVGPVGGAIGGFVAAAIIIIAIIVFVRKHQVASTKKTDRKNLTFTSPEEDEDVGLKDNVLYESAGEQFKTTPGSSGDVYAIVQKSRNEQTSNGLIQETALYAEIKKKASQSNAGDVHVLTGTNRPEKTTKKGKFKEQKKRHDDVYENITEQKTTNTPKIKNKDGLVYADLVFKNDGKRNFIIRGIENKTDYADIDLDLKADPLPSDESDKDEDSTKNEEK